MSQSAPEIISYEVDRSTHFLFGHKVFQVKGARFGLTADTKPAFFVELGDLTASLPLGTLFNEFEIDPDSGDGVLIAIVEKSLRFVKEIRPGDSIPRELLDGTASWSVEDRHRVRARAQLYARAIGNGPARGAADGELRAFIEKPETDIALQEAAAALADQAGPPLDADSVVSRIESLSRELAYLEALRERCGEVLGIVAKLNELARVYRGDRAIVDELSRIRTLMMRPTELYNGIFVRIGKALEDMVENVARYREVVEFVRGQRDELHQALMIWDSLLLGWERIEIGRCNETESKITELYRFVARHFLTSQSWKG